MVLRILWGNVVILGSELSGVGSNLIVHYVVQYHLPCYDTLMLNERFWSKVDKTGTCWLWIGAPRTGRYGQIHWDGKPRLAHRLVWMERNGDIPDGHEIHHTCYVTKCVNPDHLELVTPKQNMADARWALTEVCPQGHRYEGTNLYLRPDGGRGCRRCRADNTAQIRKHRRVAATCTCPCSCGARI